MIRIEGDQNLIEVESRTEYDYNNGQTPTSPNVMVFEVKPSWKLTQMETDIANLKFENDALKVRIQTLLDREEKEAKMREDWPALQDVYSQYQMVKTMLEDAKKPKEPKEDVSA